MPDRDGAGDPGQSRARGLGRAILDTFPVVKFGTGEVIENKDVEAVPVQATTTEAPNTLKSNPVELAEIRRSSGEQEGGTVSQEDAAAVPRPKVSAEGARQTPSNNEAVMPEAIGHETCPICIFDFEEGDDLRVLPCEGKHRFHQTCVDPWLLELSGSCPLCRQGVCADCSVDMGIRIHIMSLDFHTLEVMLSGEERGENREGAPQRHSFMAAQNRFSRYLRLARGRQLRGGAPGTVV